MRHMTFGDVFLFFITDAASLTSDTNSVLSQHLMFASLTSETNSVLSQHLMFASIKFLSCTPIAGMGV